MHITATGEEPGGERIAAVDGPGHRPFIYPNVRWGLSGHSDARLRSRRPSRVTGIRRAGLVVVALVGFALTLAACGGGSTPPTATTAGSGTPPTATPYAEELTYAQCMRSHGEPDFPDPSTSGGFNGGSSSSDIDHDSPQFVAANSACKHDLPAGPTQAQNEQRTAQSLKFAQCMRSHGISDFPDSMQITGQGDLNPNDPAFQAASTACQSLRPGPGGATP